MEYSREQEPWFVDHHPSNLPPYHVDDESYRQYVDPEHDWTLQDEDFRDKFRSVDYHEQHDSMDYRRHYYDPERDQPPIDEGFHKQRGEFYQRRSSQCDTQYDQGREPEMEIYEKSYHPREIKAWRMVYGDTYDCWRQREPMRGAHAKSFAPVQRKPVSRTYAKTFTTVAGPKKSLTGNTNPNELELPALMSIAMKQQPLEKKNPKIQKSNSLIMNFEDPHGLAPYKPGQRKFPMRAYANPNDTGNMKPGSQYTNPNQLKLPDLMSTVIRKPLEIKNPKILTSTSLIIKSEGRHSLKQGDRRDTTYENLRLANMQMAKVLVKEENSELYKETELKKEKQLSSIETEDYKEIPKSVATKIVIKRENIPDEINGTTEDYPVTNSVTNDASINHRKRPSTEFLENKEIKKAKITEEPQLLQNINQTQAISLVAHPVLPPQAACKDNTVINSSCNDTCVDSRKQRSTLVVENRGIKKAKITEEPQSLQKPSAPRMAHPVRLPQAACKDAVCFKCVESGHSSKDCPICSTCGDAGHFTIECINKVCCLCMQRGHFSKSCFNKGCGAPQTLPPLHSTSMSVPPCTYSQKTEQYTYSQKTEQHTYSQNGGQSDHGVPVSNPSIVTIPVEQSQPQPTQKPPPTCISSKSESTDTIYVCNLPTPCTATMLRDLCQAAGEVNYVAIMGCNTGIVQYEAISMAEEAVSLLHQMNFHDHTIIVGFFKNADINS